LHCNSYTEKHNKRGNDNRKKYDHGVYEEITLYRQGIWRIEILAKFPDNDLDQMPNIETVDIVDTFIPHT